MEDSFELQSSAIIAGVFRCGLIRGECMREFHPALSAISKDLSLSFLLFITLFFALSFLLSIFYFISFFFLFLFLILFSIFFLFLSCFL